MCVNGHVLHRNNVSVLKPGKRPKKTKRYNRPVHTRVNPFPETASRSIPARSARGSSSSCLHERTHRCGRLHPPARPRALRRQDGQKLDCFSGAGGSHTCEPPAPGVPFPHPADTDRRRHGFAVDRGCEFVAFEFQDALRKHHIKFRPNRRVHKLVNWAAPHLNGKVERSQRTDHVYACINRMEFWATVDRSVGRDALRPQVLEWQRRCASAQRFYNEEQTHSSLGGKPPTERLKELHAQIPTRETVRDAYNPEKEVYVTNRNYSWQPA